MSDSDVDDAVASLPGQTLRRIDEAFDRAISESHPEEKQRPRKRRRIEQDAQPGPSTEPELAGGFLLDDDNDGDSDNADLTDAGGGFVLEGNDGSENENTSASQPTHIPLALVPRALQLLDLDPSDTQVLSVFKNAASSWSEETGEGRRRPRRELQLSNLSDMDEDEDGESEAEQVISRRDWRAVCAALIPSSNPLDSPLSSLEDSDDDDDTRAVPEEESDSGSSAVISEDLEESDTSSDEYIPDSKRKGKGKSKSKGKSNSRPQSNKSSPSKKPRQSRGKTRRDSTPDTSTLTSRQQQDTLSAFALFFPSKPRATRSDLSEEELSKKRLTIKDIANAAASIKEKITAEEIIEMLAYFSSSSTQNNPTMSFQEFQQMMIAARLA
ncbi:hypothetical protein ACEPAG_2586 [Sanghuangporus baumii]